MRRFLSRVRRNERGAAALEFALVAPALILIIVGIAQIGKLFMSNAGLRNAVGEGARYATIYPRPSDTQIAARIASSRYGLDPDNMSTPSISYGVANGANYADITVTYEVDLDFIFFTLPPVNLTETRRAFVHSTT